ncbi:L-fucose:H+ symporter permease [Mucilaginibacter phyllosphaerae]|uniref:FHS family L-fucose permease-like MFS transporter n=1 Tax=Mucilaginibacter phyllosphaerae TaxID=1812349 RepID=A0A4Y8AJI4_9SPHI|nr:L-fucose:H+ symporter permease [Mucilaginibacter phyllosphaerae]MBB3968326.1 FHS family L-fucose permease-like MFS transporter [Mucilaginibacter phyllosphaerae]TEW68675.1 L-fucose:H+ symporter permease [Mucilaginibacter phyllosphaerae]GGG99696.1 L-fucose:H+ symporter permease [Mucilaginibacter phyllosphaerae]
MSKDKSLAAVALITSLFFLWGFALNLNPILIPHLKKACQLTDFQSSLIDSASYIAYFLLPIPAAQFMKKYGYKGGIIFGLLLFSIGAMLFYPAAAVRNYAFFLGALFVVFSGMAFLETAANPLITLIGDPKSATQRINFAQSFNGLAATLAPLLGGMFILSGKTLSAAEEKAMSAEQLNAHLNHEAASVQIPFVVISIVVFLVAMMVWRTAFPKVNEEEVELAGDGRRSLGSQISDLLKNKHLMSGVLAEFFYVGGQACVSSFFIRFSEKVAGFEEKPASLYLSLAFLGFMVGRFTGTLLMKFFNPVKLLVTYSVINIILIVAAINLQGTIAVYTLMAVWFFMSIMFPTIFSLSIRDLGSKTKLGSSLVIMGIVGGAVIPPIMGRLSDATNIQFSYLVPGVCFAMILWFAIKNLKVKKIEIVAGH